MASQAQVDIIMKLVDRMTPAMKKISSNSKSLGKNFTSLGKTMSRRVTLPLLAVGAASVKVASDFDASMRNIQAFGGQTEQGLKSLGRQFKDMSVDMSKTTDTANGLAKAYFNIQSAGFLAADGIMVLEVSTKAATAGLTSTQIASEGVMAILNAYKLTAESAAAVSDSLFTTIKFGVGTFEQLIPVLGDVIPIASSMRISFDEVNAALATLSKAGVSFNKGSTQIKATMTALLGPSDNLARLIKSIGFESGQALIDAKGLGGALNAIADAVGNDSSALQALFPNVRALQGVLGLTGENAQVFGQMMEEMGIKVGATQEAFEKQMKSFSAQFKNFRNIIQVAMIDIGNAVMPVLIPIVKTLGAMVKSFTQLPQPIQAVIVGFGLLLVAVGPILSIVGMLLSSWGALASGFSAVIGFVAPLAGVLSGILVPALGALSGAIATVGAALMGLFLNPVGLAILAIAALVVALLAFSPMFRGLVDQFRQIISGVIDIGVGIIKQFITIWGEILKRAAATFFQLGALLIIGLAKGMLSIVLYVVQVVSDIGNAIIGGIQGIFGISSPSRVMTAVGNNLGISLVNGFGESVSQGMNKIGPQINRAFTSFGGGVSGGGRRQAGGSLLDKIRAAISGPDAAPGARQQILNVLGVSGGGTAAVRIPALAAASSSGGDININIDTMVLPPGTTEEIAEEVLDIIAARVRRRNNNSGQGVIF